MSIDTELVKLTDAERKCVQERAELNMLTVRHGELVAQVATLKAEATTISDAVLVTQAFAGQIQTGVIDKFEDLLNRGVRQIFERDYKIDIAFEAKANSFWADIYITLPGGNRIPMSTEGGGLKHFSALLSRILYIILDSTQPAKFLFLDESLAELDIWRSPAAYAFLTDVARELGIQIIFVTHNANVADGSNPLGFDRVIKFENIDGKTVTKTL